MSIITTILFILFNSQFNETIKDGEWNDSSIWEYGTPNKLQTCIINHNVSFSPESNFNKLLINDTLFVKDKLDLDYSKIIINHTGSIVCVND